MTYNEAVNELTRLGVSPRTAYNAVRKASIQPQTVAPFGHAADRPRQNIVDIDGLGGYTVHPVWA